MFEETFLGGWFSTIVIFTLGAGAGFLVARQVKSQHTRRLEDELAQSKLDHAFYRNQVERHFQKTSVLFGKLTDDYRAVYEHLSHGAQTFCQERSSLSPMNLPRGNILPEPEVAEPAQAPAMQSLRREPSPLVEKALEREGLEIPPPEAAQIDQTEPVEETITAEHAEYEDEDETPLWDAEIPLRRDVSPEAFEPHKPVVVQAAKNAPQEKAVSEADEVYLGVESASGIDFEQVMGPHKPRPSFR